MADLRTLKDLLGSPEGRAFLSDRAIFTDLEDFTAALAPPGDLRLRAMLGLDPEFVVYSGQQVYCDYHRSVVAKFETAGALAALHGVQPLLISLDTDRCGASPLSVTTLWRHDTCRSLPNGCTSSPSD
jgi:hypothetical protein